MNRYEALFILRPNLNKDKLKDLLNWLHNVVDKSGGKVISSEVWQELRKLAYPIKKESEGTYYILNFNSKPEAISKIHQEYRL
ncbi:MAG: 30S ribosomal protein S6, partial [Candidatus Omnitrophica bacterium]|nr:30S ribosomal protein S6 [Candidatus Omnitrophota bacterium]